LGIPFVKNCGQLRNTLPNNYSFYANFLFGTVFVRATELIYIFPYRKGHIILKEKFISPFKPKVEGIEKTKTKVHYFTEKGNYANIPSYNSIALGEMYPKVELKLKAYAKRIEKIWKVLPYGEPKNIKVEIEGADSLCMEGENLLVETEAGKIIFTPPFAFQEMGGEKRKIEVAYKLLSDKVYSFEVGKYNKAYPLIIDPWVYSTFIGDLNEDIGYSIALDSENNAYITGTTKSSDFPVTSGAFDTRYNGKIDCFVVKLSADGSTILYSTFIGGGYRDEGNSIALDTENNAYITGETYSSNFPVTSGAFDTSYNGGNECFVVKLSADGSRLLYSTFLGGHGWDEGSSIALDTENNAYITGINGENDCFVAKLSKDGSKLLYLTFIRGTRYDAGKNIALDSEKNAYIIGYTSSSDFLTTSGSFNTSYNGKNDCFVVKLSIINRSYRKFVY
jgi:hypothetical protein